MQHLPALRKQEAFAAETITRRLIDLKFFKTGIGVKRWQPNYIIHRYRCRSCGAQLTSSGLVNLKRRGIYGHNLMCWCVYHNVVCKQSLLQVERSLDDIFGLRLPYRNVYRFRSDHCQLTTALFVMRSWPPSWMKT